MKIIERLSEMIDEEIADAHKYAVCAAEQKDLDPELSRTFLMLANEEMNHSNMLHTQVVRLIKKYREENGEPPADMMAIYNYLHKKSVEKAAAVKAMLV